MLFSSLFFFATLWDTPCVIIHIIAMNLSQSFRSGELKSCSFFHLFLTLRIVFDYEKKITFVVHISLFNLLSRFFFFLPRPVLIAIAVPDDNDLLWYFYDFIVSYLRLLKTNYIHISRCIAYNCSGFYYIFLYLYIMDRGCTIF